MRYREGQKVTFHWRGRDRVITVDKADDRLKMLYGKDKKTGKYWQVEYEYVVGEEK